eukprot:8198379-Lingulodinium_polyedra.AAC.1
MEPSASSARRLAVISACLATSLSLSLAGFGPHALPASAVRAAVACAAAMGQRGCAANAPDGGDGADD